MLEKSTGRNTQVSPRDAAVRRHFYSVDVDDGRDSGGVETMLGTIESAAAPLISRITDVNELPVRNDRLDLAMFLAMCWLRTPVWRKQTAEIMEASTAALMAKSYRLDPESAQRALADSELTREEIEELRRTVIADLESGRVTVELPRNALIKYFLEGAISASWTIFMLDWTVVRLPEDAPAFVLADHPVSVYDPAPMFPGGGVGLMSSPHTQVFLPLGPRVGLLLESSERIIEWARASMEAFHQMTEEERTEAANDLEGEWAEGVPTSEFIRELNLRSYATSERFVFGSQQAVTDVYSLRQTQRLRLAQVAPRGPRMHIVEDDPGSPTGVRITQTFGRPPGEMGQRR